MESFTLTDAPELDKIVQRCVLIVKTYYSSGKSYREVKKECERVFRRDRVPMDNTFCAHIKKFENEVTPLILAKGELVRRCQSPPLAMMGLRVPSSNRIWPLRLVRPVGFLKYPVNHCSEWCTKICIFILTKIKLDKILLNWRWWLQTVSSSICQAWAFQKCYQFWCNFTRSKVIQ